jgi:SAM-dependent methyltransferase
MRPVGRESRKGFAAREASGFWRRFLSGKTVLDIGYRGDIPEALPIVEGARGIDLDTAGYDGFNLPYADGAVDAVHSSHVLEHVPDPRATLMEWFRVLRIGGHLVVIVPHAYLYERRVNVPPSRWSPEHLCAFTPQSLLFLVELALPPNTYRIRLLRDEDAGYRYDLPIHQHPQGQFEITLVLQKITPPLWTVEG